MANLNPTKANTVSPIKDKKDIERMKQALSGRNLLLFRLGIGFGLRISDLLTLKIGDLRGKTSIKILEQKTKDTRKNSDTPKYRTITISKQLQKELAQLEGLDDEYLFKSRQGNKPISRQRAYQILNEAAERAGIKDKVGEVGTHTLRKTFGYKLYNSGHDLARLQSIFGHSSQKVTLRYIGIEAEEIAEAYESIDI